MLTIIMTSNQITKNTSFTSYCPNYMQHLKVDQRYHKKDFNSGVNQPFRYGTHLMRNQVKIQQKTLEPDFHTTE